MMVEKTSTPAAEAAETAEPSTTEEETTAPPQRRRRWRRFLRVALVVLLVGVLLLVFVWRSPSPVGHWNSAEGRDQFAEVYDEAMRDMPEPAATMDIRTDYGIVRVYRFEGTGDAEEPLVMLPGRASSSPVWADNLPHMLAVGDVYTMDLLGEPGMSVQDRPIENDDEQAEWLDQTLAGLPEDSFHLVGLSIGGWTGVNLALRQPDHVATLTVIDPVYVFGDMPLGTIVRSIPAAFSWLPKSWRDSFNSYTAGGAPVEDVPVARMIETGMQHYTLRLPQPTRIDEDQLADIDVPVLAIIAGESVMHDGHEAAEVAERALSNGTVSLYPDASHAVNGEYPEEITSDLVDFLDAAER